MVFCIRDANTGQWVDMHRFVKEGGLQIGRNDMHSKETKRATMNAKMYIKRIAIKWRLDVTCLSLSTDDADYLMRLIRPVWVEVRVYIPGEGVVEGYFYSNNFNFKLKSVYRNGHEEWEGLAFPLIQE